jgi:hypothetical protein
MGQELGPFDVPEPPEVMPAPWWWQVIGLDSRDPVVGTGRTEREIMAIALTETQIRACEGTIGGLVIGPRGVVKRCVKTAGDGLRWTVSS